VVDALGKAGGFALPTLRADSATEAALGLGHSHLLGKAQVYLFEVVISLFGWKLGHPCAWCLLRPGWDRNLDIARFCFLYDSPFLQVNASQVSVNRFRCSLTAGDRLNYRARPSSHVASGKDSGYSSGKGIRINGDIFPFAFS
jgi:hypothetical protein